MVLSQMKTGNGRMLTSQRWQHDKIVRSMGVVTGIVWVSLILTYLSEVRRTPVVGSVA